MKRSSQVGILCSLFAFIVSITLGLGSSQSSQANVPAAPARVRPMQSSYTPVFIPVICTWEEKRQLFDRAVVSYEDDLSEWKHTRRLGK